MEVWEDVIGRVYPLDCPVQEGARPGGFTIGLNAPLLTSLLPPGI
ncbi:hypothetical protein SAMN00790413_04065 [Deinococcus hopiensis KR-140]|uniref:Uncharacterized protein n=1 Tax=Deinococcus hopiensis KR-140 TaxID=695939 RepID=A0A1W1UNA1_9DEIO|nr:hypothetical protein SAMN00790413_04065 [Deinococcus hopiensis KR-140]